MIDDTMGKQELLSDFGIRLMDGEEVIISLRPYRFVRYAVVRIASSIVGIVLIPFVLPWAVIAKRRYHYWLTNKRVVWCHGGVSHF